MRMQKFSTTRPLLAALGLMLVLAWTPGVAGQEPGRQPARDVYARSVPSGSKVKFRGVVVSRDAETFVVRDNNRVDTQVVLTDETSIRTHGGFLRRGKRYAAADLLTGLIVEVEGRGNRDGHLVAEKIRFDESDMRAAITTETRVGPVEANQMRLSGQMDELTAIAAEARGEAAAAHERISSLDEYDVQETVVVNFRVNSAVLSPEARRQLDELAAKAAGAKGYVIEVAGHADATGGAARNFQLSRQRADAVIQYLAVNHKIPMRRFVSPMGYGETEAATDNATPAGRAQNRRVEVRILMNRGLTRPAQATSERNP